MSDRILIRWDDDLIKEGWTAVPNVLIRDASLSMEARWLWSYMRSHSANFLARMETIQRNAGCGRDKLRKIIKELVEAGYMSRGQEKNDSGKYGVPWYWLHNPSSSAPATPPPVTAAPSTAAPATENQSPVTTSDNATGDVFTVDGPTVDGGDYPLKKNKTKKTKNLVGAACASPDPRGHRLPEGFTVTPEMVTWCRTNFPALDGKAETEKFRDYWHSKAGAAARKVDWERTWKNWIRTAAERQRSPFQRKSAIVTTSSGRVMER